MNLMLRISDLLQRGIIFSDIQAVEGQHLRIRTPSGWVTVEEGDPVSFDEMVPLLHSVTHYWKSHLDQGQSINRTIEIKPARFRLSAYTMHARSRKALTLRLIPDRPPELEALHLPVQVQQFTRPQRGILLVSGATGAGKSSTIAAIVNRLYREYPLHIITIEDPIEFLYPDDHAAGVVTQREVGPHGDVASFAAGVHEAMRQCPDVIVIGEIRDQDTAAAAVRAAESGHYVIASIHARSSLGAVQKLGSLYQESFVEATLASILTGVIYQLIMPDAQGENNVVAAEVITGGASELVGILKDASRVPMIADRIRSNNLGLSLEAHLRYLHNQGRISEETLREVVSVYYAA
ncbi:MAG: ATPase, T2SS/T4P/T4SS family [Gammaproteobacteria bacterium]|nr:ATPase, T2SS/T4P/T4SS family [Gammaproteobacteria bacterium]